MAVRTSIYVSFLDIHYKVSFLIAFVQIDSTCIRSELTTRVRYQEVG